MFTISEKQTVFGKNKLMCQHNNYVATVGIFNLISEWERGQINIMS